MTIWKRPHDIETLNRLNRGTTHDVLGIEFTEVGDDYLCARMPVDARTHQPYGLLHGGVSCVLAESLGSMAANMVLEEGFIAVGTDINASHLRSVTSGWVTGKATLLKIGQRMQFWQIEIQNEARQTICSARLTVAVLRKKRS